MQEALRDRAARVLATTTRAWGIAERRRVRAASPRSRCALPRVRGVFFAI
ncbi:hypothetical protein [Variovorax paradoxus]|uniref:Uncharacterized protein n=1 Tax=Variovorax paradoxus TaxID=34073 RepID=A0A0H2MME0_VARPD|nr:hypothetical protein [Variovorax paradoxus]KLN57915.1 hypothetical protein VPARA_09260 [Variovorax paradoxus]